MPVHDLDADYRPRRSSLQQFITANDSFRLVIERHTAYLDQHFLIRELMSYPNMRPPSACPLCQFIEHPLFHLAQAALGLFNRMEENHG